jgi:hypothetical protein
METYGTALVETPTTSAHDINWRCICDPVTFPVIWKHYKVHKVGPGPGVEDAPHWSNNRG